MLALGSGVRVVGEGPSRWPAPFPHMNEFTLKALSFGPLYPAADKDYPVCAEREKRIDHSGDVPQLCASVGVKPGDVVIDLGGFVGDTAFAFAKQGASVIVYEPFLDSFVCLLYNTRDLPVKCINAPAGDGSSVKLIYDCPGTNHGMRRVDKVPDGALGSIKTHKLDDLTVDLSRLKLIKIDVEGFEIPAILGALKIIEKYKPALYVEHYVDGQRNAGFTPQQLVDTIDSLGYDREMVGTPPRWDWLCFPKGTP